MSRVYKKGVQHLYVAGSLHDDIRRLQYIVPFCLIDFRMSRAFALLYILPLIYIYCVRVVVHSRTLTHTHTHIRLLSTLQLSVSFGLLNYFFPFLPLLRPLFPIGHPHLPQVIPHIVLPSYSWSSLRSCCIRFPFVYCGTVRQV